MTVSAVPPRMDSPARLDSIVQPFTNPNVMPPMVLTHGEGVFLVDDAGKRYLDGFASLWSASLGYSQPRLVAAATRQMEKLPTYHIFWNRSPDVTLELARELLKIAPVPMARVLFGASGSDAMDTAIKLVWYYHNSLGLPHKKKIIARNKGYHGVTALAAMVSGLPHLHLDFDLAEIFAGRILHTDCPCYEKFALAGESEEDFATRLADNLEKMILAEGPETVAAFVAEPAMGAGGLMPPPKTYWEKIQVVLKKYDILLVADEVVTGLGRTGQMFGCQTYGMEPDLLTMAKALSAAYQPISAVMVSAKIQTQIDAQNARHGTFGHGYTYGGHPVCAAVALETLKIYQDENVMGHVQEIAPYFQQKLHSYASHPLVGHVRGVGLMGAIEMVADKKTQAAFDAALAVGMKIQSACLAEGLIVRAVYDGVCFAPPLIITKAEIDQMFVLFDSALAKVTAQLQQDGLAAVA